MSLTFINDPHIGAVRSAGTTPATAYQLRLDLLSQVEELLYTIDTDLCIGGDLFDGPDISKQDLLRTYQILDAWLVRTGKSLYLMNGNHDLSKNSTNFSSFQFLAALLNGEGMYAGTVYHITEGTMTPHGYMLPHVVNQEQFDVELSKVPECDYLFVHCNYDNEFAVESDHSLNLSRAQAEACPARQIVFAHEHQGREALGGKVIIVGNQFPSSVSDCLGNSTKHLLQIVDAGPTRVSRLHPTWQAEGDYSEQDWRELVDTGRFIRVVGEAAASEAGAVTTAISRFRAAASALVITNAVKIAGIDDAEQLALSHEEVTAFSVRDALRPLLTDEENNKIDKLREQNA